jgi:hypothetical protein
MAGVIARQRGVVARAIAGAVVVALLSLGSACGRETSDLAAGDASALPFDTAQDWVTYADYLVEVTVDSERAIPTAPSSFPATAKGRPPPASGDVHLGREVTASTSSSPVWTRPTLVRSRLLPTSISLAAGGWVVHDGKRKPFESGNRPRLEIGRHYLAAIAYADPSLAGGDGSGPMEWLAFALLSLDDGVVGEAASSGGPMARSLAGKTRAEVAAILTQTPADPDAAPYMAEDPVRRFQDVSRDTQPSGTPGPGEY